MLNKHLSYGPTIPFFKSFLKKLFIYLFTIDTERETETQAEQEAGSIQGARRGTRSQGSRSSTVPSKGRHPGPKPDAQPLSHLGVPLAALFIILQNGINPNVH